MNCFTLIRKGVLNAHSKKWWLGVLEIHKAKNGYNAVFIREEQDSKNNCFV